MLCACATWWKARSPRTPITRHLLPALQSDYARYREGVPQALKEGGDPTLRVLAYAYQRRHYTKKTSQWKRLLPKLQYEDPLLPKV